MARPPSIMVHEEVVEVGFGNLERARAQLAELQRDADKLVKTVGSISVGFGGGAGGGGGTGTSTGSVPAPGPSATTPSSAGAPGAQAPAPPPSSTGRQPKEKSIWTDWELDQERRKAAAAERKPPPSPWDAVAESMSRRSTGIFSSMIASGNAAAMVGGLMGHAGGAVGDVVQALAPRDKDGNLTGAGRFVSRLGGAVGTVTSVVGSAFAGGFSNLTDWTDQRSLLERDFGYSQLAGVGAVGPMGFFGRRDPLNEMLLRSAGFGIMPDEAVQQARSYADASGGRVRGAADFARLSRAGIDPSTTGHFDRSAFAMGAFGRDPMSVERFAGIGQGGFGLQGELSAFLRGLASQFDRLISRGMRVDMRDMESFLARMAGVPGLSALGARAPEVAGGLANMAGSARDQLLAPFQQLGQQAALMDAISQSGNIFDAIERLESMGPEGVRRANRNLWGRDVGGAVMAGNLGVRLGQGRDLIDLPLDERRDGLQTVSERSFARQRVRAQRAARHLTQDVRGLAEQQIVSDLNEDTARAQAAVAAWVEQILEINEGTVNLLKNIRAMGDAAGASSEMLDKIVKAAEERLKKIERLRALEHGSPDPTPGRSE